MCRYSEIKPPLNTFRAVLICLILSYLCVIIFAVIIMDNIPQEFSRTAMLLGDKAVNKLSVSRVAVFGAGGVGGYVIEALARAGVGAIDVIDNDKFDLSNINRQILATKRSIGKLKVKVAAEHIKDINPNCAVTPLKLFVLPETVSEIDFSLYDYVVDAIDTLTGKLSIIIAAQDAGVPVISSMGTGNKLDPTAFRVADIYDTSVCPLARRMREVCRKSGIKELKVLYSKEQPVKPAVDTGVPGSVSFVPSVAGLVIAGEVIKDLIER